MPVPLSEVCVLGLICLGGGGGGGGGTPVPEINASAAVTALAFIATVVAILYSRAKR